MLFLRCQACPFYTYTLQQHQTPLIVTMTTTVADAHVLIPASSQPRCMASLSVPLLQNSNTIHTSWRGLPSSHTSTSCSAHHSIAGQSLVRHSAAQHPHHSRVEHSTAWLSPAPLHLPYTHKAEIVSFRESTGRCNAPPLKTHPLPIETHTSTQRTCVQTSNMATILGWLSLWCSSGSRLLRGLKSPATCSSTLTATSEPFQ